MAAQKDDSEIARFYRTAIYCEDEDRHSNTYASLGLEKGSSAIRLKIETAVQLEQLETALFEGL